MFESEHMKGIWTASGKTDDEKKEKQKAIEDRKYQCSNKTYWFIIYGWHINTKTINTWPDCRLKWNTTHLDTAAQHLAGNAALRRELVDHLRI